MRNLIRMLARYTKYIPFARYFVIKWIYRYDIEFYKYKIGLPHIIPLYVCKAYDCPYFMRYGLAYNYCHAYNEHLESIPNHYYNKCCMRTVSCHVITGDCEK